MTQMQSPPLATLAGATNVAAGPAPGPRPDVVLDLARSRHMSAGMRAYAEALHEQLPAVAPDLLFTTIVRTSTASVSEQLLLPGVLAGANGRLVHHLGPYVPLFGPQPYIVTVHDLIHLRYPHDFKRTVAPYYRFIVRPVLGAAARILVDDERTVADLTWYLDIDPRAVRVVPLGVDAAYLAETIEPYAHAQPYILYAGNHRTHKDLPTLFAAWGMLPDTLPLDLLITGPDDLRGVPRPWRRAGTVRFLGEVDRARLAQLYRGAVALVQPSRYEGFGLPALEAAAAGTRVLACPQAVPGALAAHLERFDPGDFRALAALIAAPPQANRTASARDVARTFTWERCARATAEVYREVLEQPLGR